MLDLNGSADGTSSSVTFTENGSDIALAPAALVSDPDSPTLPDGSLTVVITSGATGGDVLRLLGRSGFVTDGNELYYNGLHVGRIFFGDVESPLFVDFNGNMTPAIAEALVRAVSFFTTSNVIAPRTVEFTLDDGSEEGNGTATAIAEVAFAIDQTVARDDSLMTGEDQVLNGNLFADNGNGADYNPDGTNEVTAVNDVPTRVGQTFELPSGALLTVNEDGTFTYNPNGRFESLVPFGSGAPNDHATDSFTYTVNGESSAAVTVTILGAADDVNTFNGTPGDDQITGTPFRDIFLLQDGGHDHVAGLAGNDTFYFGASFAVEHDNTPGDRVSGGEGTDSIILKGQYNLTLGDAVFDTSIISGIESFSLTPGSYTGFGATAGGLTGYHITTVDENVLAGGTLKFNGFYLRAGENLTINGSDETDGKFIILAGLGVDNLTGGSGNDVFFFGHDGRLGAFDVVDGGPGYDVLYLRGDYTIDFGAPPSAPTLAGIESVFLASFTDVKYASGGDGEFDYSIVWKDAMLSAGRITFNASTLGANETFSFDGRSEQTAGFRLFGGAGADVLRGGFGSDVIYGGLSADTLEGGGGNDLFLFYSDQDSTPNGRDAVHDFALGDLIDLSVIDADATAPGNQAFTFVGIDPFTGPGQLRVTYAGVFATVQGNTDSDPDAEFELVLVVSDAHPITAADFVL